MNKKIMSAQENKRDELECDIIVVGAGPIGCTAALNLHQQGFRVLILEKNAWEKVNSPYLNGISEVYWPLLQKLKIGDLVEASKVNEGHQFSLTASSRFRLADEWASGKRRFFLCRENLDVALRQAVQAADIPYLDHVQAVIPVWKQERIVGVQYTKDHQTYQCYSDLTIGCDGANSRLAKAVGLEAKSTPFRRLYQGRIYQNTQFLNHTAAVFPNGPEGQMFLAFSLDRQEAGKAYVELETDLNHPNIRLNQYKGKMPEYFQDSLRRYPEALASLANAEPVSSWQTMTLHGSIRSKLHRPGLVLLGDAASCIDPLSSSGFLVGLQGLDDLLEWVKNEELSNQNWEHWEQNYVKRVRDVQQFVGLFRWIMKYPWILRYTVNLLNRDVHKKNYILDVFNGVQSHAEFLRFSSQLKFWFRAYKP